MPKKEQRLYYLEDLVAYINVRQRVKCPPDPEYIKSKLLKVITIEKEVDTGSIDIRTKDQKSFENSREYRRALRKWHTRIEGN
jgi:hypothetical protein